MKRLSPSTSDQGRPMGKQPKIAALMKWILIVGVMNTSAMAAEMYPSLSFNQRLKHQRAIEEVYWHHRIWPKDTQTGILAAHYSSIDSATVYQQPIQFSVFSLRTSTPLKVKGILCSLFK